MDDTNMHSSDWWREQADEAWRDLDEAQDDEIRHFLFAGLVAIVLLVLGGEVSRLFFLILAVFVSFATIQQILHYKLVGLHYRKCRACEEGIANATRYEELIDLQKRLTGQ